MYIAIIKNSYNINQLQMLNHYRDMWLLTVVVVIILYTLKVHDN